MTDQVDSFLSAWTDAERTGDRHPRRAADPRWWAAHRERPRDERLTGAGS